MTDDLYKRIGRRIKSVRESLNLSQEELARRLGYTSPATISHFETGQRKISISDLQQISDILGISPESFWEAEDTGPTMQRFRLRATEVRPAAQESVAGFLAFAHKHGNRSPQIPANLRRLSPETAVEQLLTEAEVTEPPVTLNRITKYLNVPVFYWDFPDEISGVYAVEGGAACIGVNQAHPTVRQRFTIAHEIGHMIYDEEEDLYIDFTEIGMALTSYDPQRIKAETRANKFAADLLMPRKWIHNDFAKYGLKNFSFLAQRYEVSEHALWIRFDTLDIVKQRA